MYHRINQSFDLLRPFSLRRLLMLLALKVHLFSTGKVKLYSKLLDDKQRREYNAHLQKHAGFVDMTIQGLSNKNEFTSVKKMHRMEYAFSLVQELAFFDSFRPEKMIVLCESVIHNTPGTANMDTFKNMLAANQSYASELKPTGVVYCYLDASENIERRIKRGANRDKVFKKENTKDQNTYTTVEKALQSAKNKANVMQEVGVPVLAINMSENINKNATKVNEFISNLKN